jgi:hypothetical protein
MNKKTVFIILAILIVSVTIIISVGYIFGYLPAVNSISSENNPHNSTPLIPLIPSSSNPPTPSSTIITFDFDRGTPIVLEGRNTPFIQTSGGVTASFGSDSDPAAFSIQSYRTTFYTLSEFSDKFLFDNKITRDVLYIAFSQPLTEISFTFATVEYYGPGHVDEPSMMKLTTYKDSINSVIGSATAQGTISNNLFPQGNLSYNAKDKSFNLIRIEMLFQQPGGTDFLIDNIKVTTA